MTYETDPILTTIKERAIGITLNRLEEAKEELKSVDKEWDGHYGDLSCIEYHAVWAKIDICKQLIKKFEEELGD